MQDQLTKLQNRPVPTSDQPQVLVAAAPDLPPPEVTLKMFNELNQQMNDGFQNDNARMDKLQEEIDKLKNELAFIKTMSGGSGGTVDIDSIL